MSLVSFPKSSFPTFYRADKTVKFEHAIKISTLARVSLLTLLLFTSHVKAENGGVVSFEDAVKAFISSGKPSIHLRYRYEFVDDDLVPANNADASTLRAAIGYETGGIGGLNGYTEIAHVHHRCVHYLR